MRRLVDRNKLARFMKELGNHATSPGIVYFTGESTALLHGLRDQTIDIGIKLDPEPGGVFDAIAELKASLKLNVELAPPDQFIPPLPGWRQRSENIMTVGTVEFRHYDLYAQAPAKIERGYDLDIADARSFVSAGLINPAEVRRPLDAIRSQLVRYPAIDAGEFERKLERFLGMSGHESQSEQR